jgi:hypothetical protein
MGLKSWFILKAIKGELPLWMYRPIGEKMADEIGLQTETKEWWKSKTIWTAVVTALLGVAQAVGQQTGHPLQIPSYVYEVLAGLGLYSLRTGDKPIS